jgi:hypothetical protein
MCAVVATLAAALPEATSWWGSLGVLAALVLTGLIMVLFGAVGLRMPELGWAAGSGGAQR